MKKIITVFLLIVVAIFVALNLPLQMKAYIDEADSPASVVIGQTNFTSNSGNQGGSVGANTLYVPFQPYSDGTKLILPDYWNNRVLIYNSMPTSNNASADVVIGQANMTSGAANQGGAVAANTLYQPTSVYYDGNKLYICDYLNSRILIYNSIPTSNNASADVVVGQADMSSGDRDRGVAQPTAAANGLDWPKEVYSDGTKLYVTDTGNHRALIYNTIPTTDGVSADVVIGQPDMTSYGQNQNRGSDNPLANTLSQPGGIIANNGKLIISDSGNSRVIIFNSIPTTDDASANVVIGQADMVSSQTNRGGLPAANTLAVPESSYSDGTRLFVADNFNSRVLIYNSIPTTNGVSAEAVLGQPDFSSNSDNQGGSPGPNTINSPRGMTLAGSKLIMSESSNNRVLIYNVSPGITNSKESGVGPIAINAGSDSSVFHDVTLTLKADGAKEMMVSNDPNLAGASWEPYATTKDWNLSSGNSIKTVYVRFRDYANFESATYSDDIDLRLPQVGSEQTNLWDFIKEFVLSLIF